MNLLARRKLVNKIALTLSLSAMVFGLFWLAWILWTVFELGLSGLSLALFTEMTPPPGAETGGLLNAIVGSLILVVLATLIYHTCSWFKTMPLTMPVMFVGGKQVQPGVITGTGIAAAVVACLAVLSLVWRMNP